MQRVLNNLGKRTFLMGVLNITPDSFSDGGKFTDLDAALDHAKHMESSGADIIDVGAESTHPTSPPISSEDELNRLLPVIKRLVAEINLPISIDTYKASVAKKALQSGAHMVNDVWGLQRDPDMAHIIADFDCPVVIMHNRSAPDPSADPLQIATRFFEKSLRIAFNAGIKKEHIILDPGIGIGQKYESNLLILRRFSEIKSLGFPTLLGFSRKATIGRILDLPPGQRLEGTLATSAIAVMQGVDILRVHDVKENYRAIKVADAIFRHNSN